MYQLLFIRFPNVFETVWSNSTCKQLFLIASRHIQGQFSGNSNAFSFTNDTYGKYSATFQFWILQKFRRDNKFITFKRSEVIPYSQMNPKPFKSSLQNYSTHELLNFIYYKGEKSHSKYFKRHLDNELQYRIQQGISFDELLTVIDVWVSAYPSEAMQMCSFKNAIQQLEKFISRINNPYYQLQCMYYASLLKKTDTGKKTVSLVLRNMSVNDLKLFDDDELGIFCNSLFRTSTLIPGEILKYIAYVFKSKVSTFITNPAIFISIIKTFRHCQYFENDLFEMIIADLVKEDRFNELKFISKVHLFAYYSDAFYANECFLYKLITSCIDDLNDIIDKKGIVRLKDIDTLLWATCNYCSDAFKLRVNNSRIVSYIDFLAHQKFNKQPEDFVNILLWLWILENENRENLCKKFITLETIRGIKGLKNFKDVAKLNTLLSCIAIESPSLFPKEIFKERDNKLMPRINKYLQFRPSLQKILLMLKKCYNKMGISDVGFQFQIPSLYIGGITAVDNRGEFSLEILDDKVCLRDSNKPNGRMALKLRLLKAQHKRTYIVDSSSITDERTLVEFFERIRRQELQI